MKVCVLSSGSKGNCTYIDTGDYKILIDIGNSCSYVVDALQRIGVPAADIDILLITHAHIDHVKGIPVFCKKYSPKVFATKKILKEAKLNINNAFEINKESNFDNLTITAIKTSHDVTDSNGYLIENNESSCVYVTDTGYLNEKYINKLKNKKIYIFESNHDPERLMNNPKYPHNLKIRILGDTGHLSNRDSSKYLSKLIGPKTERIVLAHLSEENNTEELALTTLKRELKSKHIEFENISLGKQNELSEVFEV